uniref:SRCR domain-containing protein n=1 Tax=Anolis carolinensis TaxID=28377 RepID=A0A803U125_ANOCA
MRLICSLLSRLPCPSRIQKNLLVAVMRLADGRHRCTGRVELFLDGQWRMVSYRRWDLKEPWVVCRHLGCEAAPHPLMYPIYGEKTPSIWMDGVQCTGTETSFNCDFREWEPCNSGGSAGVICSGNELGVPQLGISSHRAKIGSMHQFSSISTAPPYVLRPKRLLNSPHCWTGSGDRGEVSTKIQEG